MSEGPARPHSERERETRELLAALIECMLAALRDDHDERGEEAARLLARYPALAHADLRIASALGDDAFVAAALAASPPPSAHARDQGLRYACASPCFARIPEAAAQLARVVTRLLDAGGDVNRPLRCEPEEIELPLLFFPAQRGNVALTRLLLERGADPNDGESIYHAAQFDRSECLEVLIAHGADPSGRHARWGNTPLYFLLGHMEGGRGTDAADRGIGWLLEHGADPEVTSGPLEETALHCAARVGRGPRMIALLLSHGADPMRMRTDGATPYQLALRHGSPETAEALAAAGAAAADLSPGDRLLAACLAGDVGAARSELAREPALLDSIMTHARSALAGAACRGHAAAVRLMVELGFPLDAGEPGGATPLHQAAWFGRPACVRLLLAGGAAVNVRESQFGCSPLAWACHGSENCRDADADYLEVVDLLLDAGADRATSINTWGTAPEAMARPAIVARLAERGFIPTADPDLD